MPSSQARHSSEALMSLKYAALLAFPVLLADHESHTPTEVCSSSVRVLVPNMEEIIRYEVW